MTDEQIILALVSDASGGSTVAMESRFDTLNLDSLEFVDLILQCDIAFKTKIPQDSLPAVNTVADLLKVIQEARAIPS